MAETMMQCCWQCGVDSDAALPQCSGTTGDELEMKAFAILCLAGWKHTRTLKLSLSVGVICASVMHERMMNEFL